MDNLAILLSETLPATFPITFEIEIAFMDARMTIKEIAQLSGVGISTVSRVLNKRPDVNEETRERVMEIIRREGYAPNTNAKHLKQLSSECVAVIVRGRKNLFFSGLLEKLQSGIERAGLQFLPYYIDENDDEILAAQRVYAERKVRGVIFLGGCHAECDELLRLLPVPCVFSTVSAAACRAENVSAWTTGRAPAAPWITCLTTVTPRFSFSAAKQANGTPPGCGTRACATAFCRTGAR